MKQIVYLLRKLLNRVIKADNPLKQQAENIKIARTYVIMQIAYMPKTEKQNDNLIQKEEISGSA
jgi:hypothetical protein